MSRKVNKAGFERLCALSPELQELYGDVCAVRDDGGPSFCANAHWHGRWVDGNFQPGFKARLVRIVGWGAGLEEETPDTLGIAALDTETNVFRRHTVSAADLVNMKKEGPRVKPGYAAELRTSAAYDTAYDYLYSLLTDCRNCNC